MSGSCSCPSQQPNKLNFSAFFKKKYDKKKLKMKRAEGKELGKSIVL